VIFADFIIHQFWDVNFEIFGILSLDLFEFPASSRRWTLPERTRTPPIWQRAWVMPLGLSQNKQ